MPKASKKNMPIDFCGLLKECNKEIHIIVHNFPDPDSIASAIGVQEIIKNCKHKPGNIYYTGEISHPQNKSMMTLLSVPIVNYESDPFEKGSPVIIVDTNNLGKESNQPLIQPEDANILAIIDHHKGKHPKDVCIDYRPVGSTSSIVWQYLYSMNFDFDSDEGQSLATALVVGISTDTNSLTSDNISDIDFDAYQYLIKKVDKQKLISIMQYPLPPYLFDLRQRAFLEENKRIEESTIVSGLGIISTSKRDALPIIADEFLRMTGITTSIVFAIINDYIDISVRSNNITLDVGEFITKVFKTGGGKQGAGRARISLGFFGADNEDQTINNDVWEVAKKLVFEKVFHSVKG